MTIAWSTMKVVSGFAFAYVMHFFATGPGAFTSFLLFGTLFLVGLSLTVHGLFTGIAAAVAAGNEQAVIDNSLE